MTLDEQAKKAGILADAVGRYTLAASAAHDRDQKRAHLVQAFTSYAHLARNMALLQGMAPNCAEEGLQEAAKVHDFIEGRAA